ncbi:hypothetical protein HMPREF9418_1506 [Neisseria macacae ATCC 33926]|uniref:Uncharacterized protein n=1 Tax=Neisseria macacae ATCC 33926 TaxID=997348 RepID=A0AA36XKF5_9NEIS|nr:hypothetical protein HMPREF9418_1506 [Neisseria macacae ATCC 33926]
MKIRKRFKTLSLKPKTKRSSEKFQTTLPVKRKRHTRPYLPIVD